MYKKFSNQDDPVRCPFETPNYDEVLELIRVHHSLDLILDSLRHHNLKSSS